MRTCSVETAAASRVGQMAAGGIRLRRLLCPVDLSETSAAALDTATELARACGAEITALFVFPSVRPYSTGASSAPPQLFPDAGVRTTVAKDVEEFVRGARTVATVNARIEVGDPAAEILAAARDTKADAIVMGTHGRSGIECWLLGSVAQKVLRGAPCPVMTVSSRPERPAAAAARLVLCALDVAERTTEPLKYALHLGRATGRPVCVVHVIEDPWQYDAAAHLARLDWDGLRRQLRNDASAGLEQRIRAECEKGESVERLVLAGKPYREILQLAQERDASMIVVGRQGEMGGARAPLFGSTAERLMRGARCPVLTVRTA